MKISVNWIKQFVDFELPPVDELVEKIGAQLGEVEEAIDLGQKYQRIIVAKVVSCEKHPNADKLQVCTIDDGGKAQGVERDENGHVQVVCGAPNVRAGLTVAWLPPGTTVPATSGKDPLVLEARDIRGQKSNGMLASPKELAISDDHSGILEIDKDAAPGTDFAELYKLDDHIIDIENKMFTHRPDCFGALGVAREIAGILGHAFKSPDWYKLDAKPAAASGATLPLTVKNELPGLVPRFTAVALSGVSIKPSPVWLQVALTKVGVRPINNVVDLTNLWMLVTGQPLHAYDYDKVKALNDGEAAIVIRKPHKGEKIKLLNGKEIEPRAEAIMIATDRQLIGVGGVMGGSETEVDAQTKNIILECANFDMYSIRRTAMEHGLFTDAVTRFSKGQSPLQCLPVLAKTISDVQRLAGGQVAGELIDDNHVDKLALQSSALHGPITVSAGFINQRLGLQLDEEKIMQLLENVEFGTHTTDRDICITVPFWRTDIEIPEDIVEEVGRLYGYDHLPLELPGRDLTPAPKDPLFELKARIRAEFATAGANEVLTYSFVHGDLLDKAGQDRAHAFQLGNALSPDLQYYRLSLTPSLLDKVHANLKAGYDEFALFELGKAHIVGQTADDGLPREDELAALVVAAADKLKKTGAAYFAAKQYLETLVRAELTYQPVPENMQKFDITKPFAMSRTAFVYAGKTFLGLIGEFRPAVTRALKLPRYCAGFELDATALGTVLAGAAPYVPLPRFPSVTQDITLKVAADLPYQELYGCLHKALQKAQPEHTHAQLGPLDIFQHAEDAGHRHVTFRLKLASYERTLTDKEVNRLLDTVAAAAKEQFGAERI